MFEYADAPAVSADFGAGSFIAFRFGTSGNYNYGYLEVTWDSSNTTFQILSGAYESDVNTAILAGATGGAPVPGPAFIFRRASGGVRYHDRRGLVRVVGRSRVCRILRVDTGGRRPAVEPSRERMPRRSQTRSPLH